MTISSRAKIPDKLRKVLSNLDSGGSAPGGAVDWVDVTGKPATFPPETHTHPTSAVTGLDTALAGKQDTLVSTTNIKTINGSSVLGSGDLVVSGGVSDGDKGDVVVSSSGSVWTIEPAAVRAVTGYATTATSGGTTTLTASSADKQFFTGTLGHTIVLPDVTTLTLGRTFEITNSGTDPLVYVQSSGLNQIGQNVSNGHTVAYTCIALTGTGSASWKATVIGSVGRTGGGNNSVFANSPSFTGKVTVAASTTSEASLIVPHGTAPSSPVDGDMWTTTAGVFVRVNGTTVDLTATGSGGGGSPILSWII